MPTTPSPAPPTDTGTATLHDVQRAHDGVYLVYATCDLCGRKVSHGAGSALSGIVGHLGPRVSHCGCRPSTRIVDPDGVLARRQADLQTEAASPSRQRRQRRAVRRRLTAP